MRRLRSRDAFRNLADSVGDGASEGAIGELQVAASHPLVQQHVIIPLRVDVCSSNPSLARRNNALVGIAALGVNADSAAIRGVARAVEAGTVDKFLGVWALRCIADVSKSGNVSGKALRRLLKEKNPTTKRWAWAIGLTSPASAISAL